MIDLGMLCTDLKDPQSKLYIESNNHIHDIYSFLTVPSVQTRQIIDAWKEEFYYIYGDVNSNISSNNKLKPSLLFARYGITYSEERWAEELQQLFFSVQTYFSLLIKCMMARILTGGGCELSHEDIILGRYARTVGVQNYIYEDWYCWPMFELTSGFDAVMERVIRSVHRYAGAMEVEDFVKNNNFDYIKQMYEAVIPKELRHALGEYYTPDWLAELTLKEVCDSGGVNLQTASFIDPTCGSGTFIFKAIMAKREAGVSLEEIIRTVYGFDINPLAVLTAKTNYLLAVLDLLCADSVIFLPVYNVDVVRLGEGGDIGAQDLTYVQDFVDADAPVQVIRNRILADRNKVGHLGRFDVVIGNPPWVNWEYMPERYRTGSQHKWVDYRLFSAKGRDLSFSKEDISVLITYIVMDLLLKDQGVLGVVIRQGVFKSVQNGVGFRRFRIREETPLRVLRVDDLSGFRAFGGAVNSTALFFARKGEENVYPVPYYLWEKKGTFTDYSKLSEVLKRVAVQKQDAVPAVEGDSTSIWVTGARDAHKVMAKLLGTNEYRARTGVFTGGANAVYWLKVEEDHGETVRVSNLVARAKRRVDSVSANIEKTYVFPMLKGSDIKRWNVAYDTFLLCPHTVKTKMWPVSQEEMREEVPETFAYLSGFRDALESRRGFAGWEKDIQRQEFHAVLRVGDYTFAPYKVVWRYIARELTCAVISTVNDRFLGEKMLIPNEKVMYVGLYDEREAYYLCGILSSTYMADCVKGYMNPTCISTHVLDKLNIPLFDRENAEHMEIARICKAGHGREDTEECVAQIDSIVAGMYRL
ncbi:MAG: N-6 DNA methylase [Butyrivibrio sp.]|nr:N-6 DNA methylase [Muribaculum sp.]MCM1551381.1 N-6 DNA methylase [Butyrivibrio sp.]